MISEYFLFRKDLNNIMLGNETHIPSLLRDSSGIIERRSEDCEHQGKVLLRQLRESFNQVRWT